MMNANYIRLLAAAAVLASAFGYLETFPNEDIIVNINEAGGVVAGVDGLSWIYGYGVVQVYRGDIGYIYGDDPNNSGAYFPSYYLVLQVGTNVAWSTSHLPDALIDPDVTPVQFGHYSTTIVEADKAFHSDLSVTINSSDYIATVDARYTFPNEYMQFDLSVTIPEGNTEPVRLFMACDSYLGGDDEGPGFHIDNTVVGVHTPEGTPLGDQIALGYINTGGVPWSGYQSAFYSCNLDQTLMCDDPAFEGHGPMYGTNYNGYVDPEPNTDNGFGISIDFGTAPGTYTSNTVIFVTTPANINAIVNSVLNPLAGVRPYAIIVSLWIGFAFFGVFALLTLAGACMAPKSASLTFVFLINAITALAYLIMVLTDTSFTLWCGEDRAFDWLRYAAWGSVAPLTIALLATIARVPTGQAVYTAVLAFVSVVALFAAAVSPICIAAWPLLAFAIAVGIVVVIQLMTGFRAAAAANLPASVSALFNTYVWAFILLSTAYAIVWGTAEGGKVADATQEIITYTVLDVLTKVVLNAFLLLGVRSYHQYGSCTAWLGTGQLDFDIKSV